MSGETPYRKKLIEVALPLDDINVEAAREKSIRHGHPSTLHLWWARRPLAACRAVLFAQLVDDPSAHPDQFPDEESQDKERERLFDIIRDLVKWENSTNEDVLEAARAEIRRSCDGNPPPILDPFAGGGSIPLEAQRLGLEAHASDLNPVAVLINKALIEIPPRWANHPPVHPDAENRTRWLGAEGLAEDVRRYGHWMRDEAERRIGHLYPKATLSDGQQANVIAWIWARTVTCPNPACGATMPLVRSFWLGKKKGKESWVRPVVDAKQVRFEVSHDRRGPDNDGTVSRAGARCLPCGNHVSLAEIRAVARKEGLGVQLIAVAAEGDRQRIYLDASQEHIDAADMPRPDAVPDTPLPDKGLGFRVQAYGFERFSDLFTNRQLVVLATLTALVSDAVRRVAGDCQATGAAPERANDYARAVGTYLALLVGKAADRYSALCGWDSSVANERPRTTFARHAVSMVWDFAEADPFNQSSGNFAELVMHQVRALGMLRPSRAGSARQADARKLEAGCVVATDPPYYDNIGYADLSDFFYSWLRLGAAPLWPELFGTISTPKSTELIADPSRHEGVQADSERYFEDGFVEVFRRARSSTPANQLLTIFYAFKQSEDVEDGGLGSTGWSTMLEGLAAAGWMVTATWPMRTESAVRMRAQRANALASSVVLACRPRPDAAGVTDRQGLIRALRAELPGPLRELQKAHIAPVDLRQAAIGPGMAVFSRFARVIEPDGSTMRVRTALGLINQVLDQVLDEQEQEFDAETRWAIHWFAQFYGDEGPYGVAEQLAVSMNVAVNKIVDAGIVDSGRGKVRLLGRDELPDRWDPLTDMHTPVWEATQHLVKRLETEGETSAARLLRRLGGLGDSAQLLAYRLYTVCEKSRPALAGPYNALVASWPEIQRLAAEVTAPAESYEQQSIT